jgi:hypothetical protein
VPPEPARFRRFLATLTWQPRTYPQVWCWAVAVGLATTIGVMVGGQAVGISLAAGAASVTACAGVFGSYLLSRRRAAASKLAASTLRTQRPQL